MFDRILITRDYNFMPKLEVLAHFPLVKPIWCPYGTDSGDASIEDSEMPSLWGKTVRAWVFFSAAAPLGSQRNSRTRLNPPRKKKKKGKKDMIRTSGKWNKRSGRSVRFSLMQVFKRWRKYPLQTLGRQSTFQSPWQRHVTELAAVTGTLCRFSRILTPSSLASKPYLLRWWE